MNAVEVIKKIAEEEVKNLHLVELGVVTSIFPHSSAGDNDNYDCHVQLKNRDLELRRVPVATPQIGFTNIPEIGDLVLLAFINGNINAPVIIGRLYNDQDRPPENNRHEIVFESPYSTEPGIRRLFMKFPNNCSITLTDDDLTIEMGASGMTKVTIKTDGDVSIESAKNINIATQTGDIKLSAMNIKLESTQDISLSAGMNAQIKANMTAKLDGTTTEVTGSANAKLEGMGMLDVKSGGILSFQGSIVKIN
jgi:hypothetical protein